MSETYQGSSREMTAYAPGFITVKIGDYWSAGDKGRSNQPIPGMGRARHLSAVKSFKLAQAHNIPTHFVQEHQGGFVVEEFSVPTHEPLSGQSSGEVLDGEWIWRLYLKGSLWEMVRTGEVDPVELGFAKGYQPKEGDRLPRMRIGCTTKYEPVDRHLSDEEARDRMQLSMQEWGLATNLLYRVADVTDTHARKCGFYPPDGKCELARRWGDRSLLVVDTFGTPDENRVIHLKTHEVHSKDLIRDHLKEVGYMALLKEAKAAHPNNPELWPDYPTLPDELVHLVSLRYNQYADAYVA